MDPRDAILEEHDHLRRLLGDVLVHAGRARDGDSEAAIELARRVAELAEALRRHRTREEAEAAPLIESLDAWGAERRRQLGEAHKREEDSAARLRTAVAVDQVVKHVGDIVAALGWEEREILTAEALRPDAVVAGQSDG
jgi:hemerythrin-like domain-containing protein